MPTRLKRLVRFAREHLQELGFERRRQLVESLLQQLSVLTPEDLDLPSAAEISSWPTQVHYKSVFHDQELDVGVFLLPRGASIPLHDHPFMTVFSKVLYGNVRFKALDWCKVPTTQSHAAQPHAPCGAAQVVSETLITADSPVLQVLPTRHNLHSIYAETDCAFIDLAIPPYGDERECSYFDTLTCREYASHCAAQDRPASLPLSLLASNMSLWTSAMTTASATDAHDSDADPGSPMSTVAADPSDFTVPRTSFSPPPPSSLLPSINPMLASALRLPPAALLASTHQPPVLTLGALHVYQKSPSGSTSPSYAAQLEQQHQSHHSHNNSNPNMTTMTTPDSHHAHPCGISAEQADPLRIACLVGQPDLPHAESSRHSSTTSASSASCSLSLSPAPDSAPVPASLLAAPHLFPHVCRYYPAGHVHLVQVALDFIVEPMREDGDEGDVDEGDVPFLDPSSSALATSAAAAQPHPQPPMRAAFVDGPWQ